MTYIYHIQSPRKNMKAGLEFSDQTLPINRMMYIQDPSGDMPQPDRYYKFPVISRSS